jgi:hypothetical protein
MPALMRDPSRIADLPGEYHHDSRNTRTPHHHDHTDTGLEGFRNELRNAAASFRDVDSISVDVILATRVTWWPPIGPSKSRPPPERACSATSARSIPGASRWGYRV